MIPSTKKPASTIIISVYKDHVALALILDSLLKQSVNNFEVIVSEDGEYEAIKTCINDYQKSGLQLSHLTQEDSGFRKNIALNRAIKASNSDHLIFIDGDCVPHTAFVEAHQSYSGEGVTCTGRRLELGDKISHKLRNRTLSLSRLTNMLSYLLLSFTLYRDKAKNLESGIFSKTLSSLTINRKIRILGCNFSSNKNDLIKINGFNEDYLAPGIGEDSDIDWRLSKAGVTIKNVKFSAIQYHLYHPRAYGLSEENVKIFEATRRSANYACSNGLVKN